MRARGRAMKHPIDPFKRDKLERLMRDERLTQDEQALIREVLDSLDDLHERNGLLRAAIAGVPF